MNIGNCHFCGKATGYLKFKICKECYAIYFRKVKEYLLQRSEYNIEDISNDLGLPIKLIEQFYSDGILESSNNEDDDIIKKYESKQDFEKVQSMFALKSTRNKVRELESNSTDRMFFLGRDKR